MCEVASGIVYASKTVPTHLPLALGAIGYQMTGARGEKH